MDTSKSWSGRSAMLMGQVSGHVLEARVKGRPQAQSENPDSAGYGPGRSPPCVSVFSAVDREQ